jgi:hypothetical protein
MKKKIVMLIMLGCLAASIAACSPGNADPAAQYYPTYTAIAQGLIDLVNTATAKAALPAETPTPPLPVGGTENVKQPDGTTKYSDYDASFEMSLPAGWIGVRPGNQEFNDVLDNEGANNQALKDQMTHDQQGYEPVKDRYYLYATKPDVVENDLLSFAKLAWSPSDPQQVDQNALGELVRGLEMTPALPGLRVVSSNIVTNGNNVPVIVIGANWTYDDGNGNLIPLYLNVFFFKPTENGTVRIVMSTDKEQRGVIEPDVEKMVQSIKKLGQ